MIDHYRALGIDDSANSSDIKRAYRRLARRFHPDVSRERDAQQRMSELNEAYRVLSDPTQRADYDARRRVGIVDAPPAPTVTGGIDAEHAYSIPNVPSPIYCLDFSPNGNRIVLGCFDNVLRTVTVKTGRPVSDVALAGGAVTTIRWITGDRIVASGESDHTVYTWQIVRGKVTETKAKRAKWVSQMAISPDGKRVALGSIHRSLVVIDRKSGKTLYTRRRHESPISAVAYSSDGNLIASGGGDEVVVLYEASTGIEYALLSPVGAAPTQICFDRIDSMLAVGLADRTIRVYVLQSGECLKSLWGHEQPIEAVAFHPSSWLLASACRKGEIRLWNALGGKLLMVLKGHSGPIKALKFSRDGKWLAGGGLDRTLSLWAVNVDAKPPDDVARN